MIVLFSWDKIYIQGASKKRGPFGFAVTQNISEYQNIRIYPKLLITVFVSSYGTNLDLKF